LGFQQQSGRQDGVNASFRADAERERGRHQLRGNARVLYSELNSRINTERSDASARWRYQLRPRIFSQTVTSYQTDNVKGIDHNIEQNVGFGYALLKKDRHVVNLGGGATGQYRQSINIDGFAVLAEVFEDYTYRINGRLTFAQDLLAQYSPVSNGQLILRNGSLVRANDDVENYRIRFNTSLQGRVTDRISMNLRFEYEYDNTIAEASAKVDQRVSSSLGYAF
jgi:putative salt-induced outer membrane protein YdiY